MEKENVKRLLVEHDELKEVSEYISREISEEIKEYEDDSLITIVSGVRRSGKSTLLKQIRKTIKNSYYVNFDDDRLIGFDVTDFQMMHELLIELFGNKEVFFFDEIQNIKGWERFARRLHDDGKKIYITGSNASMLSKELGTHLTGRNIMFKLFPFSFREFLSWKNKSTDFDTTTTKSETKRSFNEYLIGGGFPEYVKNGKDQYLKTVYENILYRDIIARYKLPSEKTVKETAYYAAGNIGKEISYNRIRKLIGLSSATTVKEYLEYFENSYLFFLVNRYDPSIKKQAYYNKKIYMIDNGMSKILGFRTSEDLGRLLENCVFLEMKRKGEELYFHKEKHECDFIKREGTKITQAIQVTVTLGKNKEREYKGLLEAMKRHRLKEGLILTDDDELEEVIENRKIKVMPVWKWLLTKE
jgi:hypothetical protein